MLKHPYIEKGLLPFHAIVCHFLVNDTGRKGWGREKNDKMGHGGRGTKKAILRMMYFLNDPRHIPELLACSLVS